MPAGEFHHPSPPPQPPRGSDAEEERLWSEIKSEARVDAEAEPALASYPYPTMLSHSSWRRSLSFHLGNKPCSFTLLSTLFLNILSNDSSLRSAAAADLCAAPFRDPACTSFSHSLLNYQGFLAWEAQRVAHKPWTQSRRPLALAFALPLQSRISDVFPIDIHPAAKIGKGILFDHATGVVVGDNVSILHHVTLGGTCKFGGDCHPKIGDGVLIGAGATILGNVKIGEGAKIGADSLVLIDRFAEETRLVSNAGIGCREKPEGHLLNADRSKEKRENLECGGGGVGGAMAAEHGEYASGGGGNGSGRCGRFKRGAITILLILSLINAVSASIQPHAPPSPYSPQSPIFPPKTHYPPPPLAGNNNPPDDLLPPPPPDEDSLSDVLGTPPPPSEFGSTPSDCRSLC